MNPRCFRVHPVDNVATLLDDAVAGAVIQPSWNEPHVELIAREPIARGHKIALADLPAGAAVIKFAARIGHSRQTIRRGAWVHLHNLASDLDERSGGLDLKTGVAADNASAYA